MVAKGQQLLWQVLIHWLVSKQSTSLVSGDQIGWWRLKDKFEIISEIDMKDRIIASPVAISDRLLIRTNHHLFCIGRCQDLNSSIKYDITEP